MIWAVRSHLRRPALALALAWAMGSRFKKENFLDTFSHLYIRECVLGVAESTTTSKYRDTRLQFLLNYDPEHTYQVSR